MNLTLYLLRTVGLWSNIIIAVYAWQVAPNETVFWQILTRLSGRVSLLIFIGIWWHETQVLKAKPIPSFFGKTTIKDWSMSLAINHFLHLLFIAIYVKSSGIELIPIRLLGGALAYVWIGLMPFVYAYRTTIPKILRMGYLYYVWFVMFMTYIPRIRGNFPEAGGNMAEYLFFFSVLIVILLGHFIALFYNTKAKA
ncbi:MAG: hypothetical protein EAZ55_02860 [Cytophagales bacterium]|nr:MAG: hypothetical protein EAZ55_02860 [Cytophagales bacterium]